MEKSQVIIATYDSLATGRNAVQSLLEAGFERVDIGLAQKEGAGDGSLVTVTVAADTMPQAEDALNQHGPQMLQTREVQWRREGGRQELPDVEGYTAVDLAD